MKTRWVHLLDISLTIILLLVLYQVACDRIEGYEIGEDRIWGLGFLAMIVGVRDALQWMLRRLRFISPPCDQCGRLG